MWSYVLSCRANLYPLPVCPVPLSACAWAYFFLISLKRKQKIVINILAENLWPHLAVTGHCRPRRGSTRLLNGVRTMSCEVKIMVDKWLFFHSRLNLKGSFVYSSIQKASTKTWMKPFNILMLAVLLLLLLG